MRSACILLAVTVVVWPGAVSARESKQQKEARLHYKQGITHYDLGEYDQAIAEFKAAYELSQEPALLFNIAQAYRLMGDCGAALRFYKNYLLRAPDAPNRADVDRRITEMEACVAASQKPAPPDPGAEPVRPAPPDTAAEPVRRVEITPIAVEPRASDAPPRPGRTKRRAGIGTMAAGVALAATGGWFALGARRDSDRLDELFASGGEFTDEYAEIETRGQRYETYSVVCAAAGGAALAGGMVLWWLGRRQDEEARRTWHVSASIGADGGRLVWSSSF